MRIFGLTIKVTSFDILTLVKSGHFFIFFLRDYIGLMTRVMSPSTLELLFIGLSPSHDPSRRFGRLTQLTHFFHLFFLIDFFSNFIN